MCSILRRNQHDHFKFKQEADRKLGLGSSAEKVLTLIRQELKAFGLHNSLSWLPCRAIHLEELQHTRLAAQADVGCIGDDCS